MKGRQVELEERTNPMGNVSIEGDSQDSSGEENSLPLIFDHKWDDVEVDASNTISQTFFRQFDRYFGPDYVKECSKSLHERVDDDKNPIKLHHLFEETWKKNARDKIKGSKSEKQKKLQDLCKLVDRPIPLLRMIWLIARRQLLWALFFKILQQMATLTIPFIMKGFIDQIAKKPDEINNWTIVSKCFIVGILTFFIEVWNHLSDKHCVGAKIKTIEAIKTKFFTTILDSNIEFLSVADTTYTSKMLVHELKPMSNFILSSVKFVAAFVSIPYTIVMLLISKIHFNRYFMSGYVVFVLILIMLLHLLSKHYKRQASSLGSIVYGQVEQFCANARFIKANSLQAVSLKGLWTVKSKQGGIAWKIRYVEMTFDFLFETPVLVIFLMIILYMRKTSETNNLSESSLYEIIGLTDVITGILTSLSGTIMDYQNFRPSANLYEIFFNYVSRSPSSCVSMLPGATEGAAIVRVQVPEDERHKHQSIRYLPKKSAVIFDHCVFYEKSLQATKVLQKMFKENKGAFSYDRGEYIDRESAMTIEKIEVKTGTKVCVMGRLDQKNSLAFFLECLSNEHELAQGKLYVRGRVNHFDLKWFNLLEESFIENIVLDAKIDYRRLFAVCRAVDLNLSKFSGGRYGTKLTNPNMFDLDRTKILLARALYADFDIFVISTLFDKIPFDVRAKIFDSLVMEHLGDTTVIYHSNDKVLAEKANLVLVFRDNKLIEEGTPAELGANPSSQYNIIAATRAANTTSGFQIVSSNILASALSGNITKILGNSDTKSSELMNKINAYQEAIKTSNFFTIALIIMSMKRKVKNIIDRRQKKLAGTDNSQLMNKSTFKSFYQIMDVYSTFTPYKIGFIFLLWGLLMMTQNLWIGWWGDNYFKLKGDTIYIKFLIIFKVVLIFYIIIKHYAISSTEIGFCGNMYFLTCKKLIKSSLRWVQLVTVPLITFNASSCHAVIDGNVSGLLRTITNSTIIVTIGLIIANLFYPVVFIPITILVLWYGRKVVKDAVRSQRLTLGSYLASGHAYFSAFTSGRHHAVSMRYIGCQNYLFGRVQDASCFNDRAGNVVRSARVYVQHRTAYINAGLVFFIYLCPLFMIKIKFINDFYGYSTNLWLVGFLLIWSRQMADNISGFMKIVSNTFIFSEVGLRMIEFQSEVSTRQLQVFDGNVKQIKDEVDDNDLAILFKKKYELRHLEYVRSKSKPVIKIQELNHQEQGKLLLSNLNITINYEDKVALIQNQSSAAIDTFLDIVMGFVKIDDPAPGREETSNKVEINGINISGLRMNQLRSNLFYLMDDPPIFIATLRDIVDPSNRMPIHLIVKVLHFFGFYNEFCLHIDKYDIQEVKMHVSTMEISTQNDNYFSSKVATEIDANMIRAKKKKAKRDRAAKKNGGDVNPLGTEMKTAEGGSGVKVSGEAGIQANRMLAETRRKDDHGNDDELLDDRANRPDFISEFLGLDEKQAKKAILEDRPIEPTKMYGYLSTGMKASDHLLNKTGTALGEYAVYNSDEREIISRILNCRFTYEDRLAPLNLRKIIWIARAVLEYPEILIVDEDSLIIEGAQPGYLNAFFEYLKQSTMLCKITSYQAVDKFERQALFEANRLVQLTDIQKPV